MDSSTCHPVDSEMRAALLDRADVKGRLAFDVFVEVALYHPTLGYYRRRDRPRIGRSDETDFYTASTLSESFAPLVMAAARHLLPSDCSPADFTFVEIGAEQAGGILRDQPHPFRAATDFAVGDALSLPSPAIVFSNELFDAQPFRRFLRMHGAWRERGVAIREKGLCECLLDEVSAPPEALPQSAPEGYSYDFPTGAQALAEKLAAMPWNGLFLAFDYGKTAAQLATDHPEGTARAYSRHRQHNNLLEGAGHQDLTCHICWDDLKVVLEKHDFRSIELARQEAFFVHHAAEAIAHFVTSNPDSLSAPRRQLMELLHPQHLGTKFQVLSAIRP